MDLFTTSMADANGAAVAKFGTSVVETRANRLMISCANGHFKILKSITHVVVSYGKQENGHVMKWRTNHKEERLSADREWGSYTPCVIALSWTISLALSSHVCRERVLRQTHGRKVLCDHLLIVPITALTPPSGPYTPPFGAPLRYSLSRAPIPQPDLQLR